MNSEVEHMGDGVCREERIRREKNKLETAAMLELSPMNPSA